jgi:hypothetical protein
VNWKALADGADAERNEAEELHAEEADVGHVDLGWVADRIDDRQPGRGVGLDRQRHGLASEEKVLLEGVRRTFGHSLSGRVRLPRASPCLRAVTSASGLTPTRPSA